MEKTNVDIVQEYIEVVGDQQHLERKFDYLSHDCVYHIPPYVGLGIMSDMGSNGAVRVWEVAPGGPADGKIVAGDELVRVQDDQDTWETLADLKERSWGRGVLGGSVTLTVRRDGVLLDIPLVRSLMPGREIKIDNPNFDDMDKESLKIWPDLKTEMKLIFGQADLVACYAINMGTNTEYQRTAVWPECDLFRLKDNKIVEIWFVEDNMASMGQLGYKIEAPEKVKAD